MFNIKTLSDFSSERNPAKLIEIPGDSYAVEHRGRYGVTTSDTWNLDSYLARVLANAIRMFAATTHGLEDQNELELIACYFEFYSTEIHDVLHAAIDWSQDKKDTDDLLEWINAEDRSAWPGMNEFSEKSETVEYWQHQYGQEAMNWVARHWMELWD